MFLDTRLDEILTCYVNLRQELEEVGVGTLWELAGYLDRPDELKAKMGVSDETVGFCLDLVRATGVLATGLPRNQDEAVSVESVKLALAAFGLALPAPILKAVLKAVAVYRDGWYAKPGNLEFAQTRIGAFNVQLIGEEVQIRDPSGKAVFAMDPRGKRIDGLHITVRCRLKV